MPEVHVPLVHGANEAVDPKLLPDGWLTRAENVRFRKDGRLGSRFGYDFISGTGGGFFACGTFGPKHGVYIRQRTLASQAAFWADRRPDGSLSTQAANASIGTVGVPRRQAVARGLTYGCTCCDTTTANGLTYSLFLDSAVPDGLSAGLSLVVTEPISGRVVFTRRMLAVGCYSPKLVAVGTDVCVVYVDISNPTLVRMFVVSSLFVVTVFGTVVTAAAGRGFTYDIAPYDGTKFLLAYESSGVNLAWGTVTPGGGYTNQQDTVIANPVRPSITGMGNGNVSLVWAEGATFYVGNVSYRTSTIAGSAVVGVTSLDASGLAVGFPVAGAAGVTTAFAAAWNRSDNSFRTFSGGNVQSGFFLAVVSKPFNIPSLGPSTGTDFVWTSNYTKDSTGRATYKLVNVGISGTATTSFDGGVACEALSCQTDALPGYWFLTSPTAELFDNRRSTVASTTSISAPSATSVVTCLPVLSGRSFGADLIRIENSVWADRLLPANINGQLVFSGPRVVEFDGSRLYETGMASGPEYCTVANAGAGTVAAGTYQYVVVYAWADAAGRKHRSPPSLPVTITLTGASNVTVSYSTMACTERLGPGVNITQAYSEPNVNAEVYRTQAGGTVFYLVNDTIGNPLGPPTGTLRTYTDSATDASISDNAVLYTQGARGGLSGLLQNDEPPPCRFIWAGNNRVILGGLEEGSAVQWSKLIFTDEPLQFSNDPGYRATVDGEVTCVACLDGAWLVFTASSIWVFQGDGPDDTGAGGSFGDPRKLPSDVGCISQRSLVEVPQGLLFQGRSDRIYLLPRGGGAPQWIGQSVRDTLALYPFIAAAKLVSDSNVVVFSCLNTAGTDGVLIVYDTRIGEWTVDIPFNGAQVSDRVFRCLDVYNGKLVLDGKITETSLYADDETGGQNRAIVSTLVTGDMRPFGALGHGRFLRLALLSEYRSATTFTIEESLDGGVTYQTAASFTPSNSAGDTVKVAYDLPIVKGEAYRFRIISTPTSPGEGFVFNSITGEVFPDQGTPRLANAYRA